MMYHLCKNERKVLSNYHNNRINNFSNMKKKNLSFVAAAMVMAGCASDDMIGDNNAAQSDNQVIGFNMSTPAMTRAEGDPLTGSTAADKLGGKFFVWGEKNENDDTTNITEDVTAANTVFKNYTVKYGTNTANTTTSNTKDWEYVGLTDAVSSTNLAPQTTATQTIKYWDAKASDYTFTAVSAKPEDIGTNNNKVVIKKIIKASDNGSALDKGYEITIKDLSAAANVYVSDRVNIAKKDLATGNPENAYGGYVNFTFRNFQSKVRFGIYEKVPGYKVVITKITGKEAEGTGSKEITYSTENGSTNNFGVTGNFVVAGDATKYNVTYEGDKAYETGKTTVNRAKVTVANGSKTVDYLNTGGTNWLSTTSTNPVGTDATGPTWDTKGTSTGDYTAILPNPDNTTDMTLQVAYKLISEDTGEEIAVDTKEVKVPAEYCQWKPNFAYTYLFKITDKSADLYPITFDACVVEDETGKQETITTVSEPSWTVFATNTAKSAYKTITNEFAADDVIYATLSVNGTPVDLSSTSAPGKLYTVTTTNSTNYPITEASVADALKKYTDGNALLEENAQSTLPVLNVKPKEVTTSGTVNFETNVPSEDGNTVSLGSGKAMYWTAVTNTVYAVEYTDADGNKTYKVIKIGGATGQSN